jgi:predicted exporter
MTRAGHTRWTLFAWIAFLAGCGAIIHQTRFVHDLSAFLPRSPSPQQELLVEQLRDGVVSRLVLIGIEGADAPALARTSKELAAALRGHPAFVSVENGEMRASAKDRDIVWRYRYFLSPATLPARFSASGLRDSLEQSLELLVSPAGVMASGTLAADPTGELLRVIEPLAAQRPARMRAGVWFSPDDKRALLVAQTRARGSDIDGQEAALDAVQNTFRGIGASPQRLLVSGPGVFSVRTRAQIKQDAWQLSLVATGLVAALLLALYRSARVLALGLVPVATGALAGIAAVGAGFGSVHGITLAFGVTLIGEGVDYAIYFFVQKPPQEGGRAGFTRLWPTLRLGVLTSVCGFSAMLFSGFTGLAQLGLFSIAGLVVAAGVTRWVLPVLAPSAFNVIPAAKLGEGVLAAIERARRLTLAVILALVAALGFVLMRPHPLWSMELASLSPVPASDRALDQELRRDLGAPDIRHLVVVRARTAQGALEAAERAGTALGEAVRQGLLDDFDSPALHLPSERSQLARRAALPEPRVLSANLAQAAKGLPFRSGLFKPFLDDVAAARTMAPLDRKDLEGSALGLKVDALLIAGERGWSAVLPLRGVKDSAGVARLVDSMPGLESVVLDLKRESDGLYRDYLHEALGHAAAGALAIMVLLSVSLRSTRRVFNVVAPLAAAVLMDVTLLGAVGGPLSIFHLVGLLLVVAVGSNYSLFFDRLNLPSDERMRMLVSVMFAGASTIIAFGVLAFSGVAVLHAIGTTVAIGAFLALLFSATFSRDAHAV